MNQIKVLIIKIIMSIITEVKDAPTWEKLIMLAFMMIPGPGGIQIYLGIKMLIKKMRKRNKAAHV